MVKFETGSDLPFMGTDVTVRNTETSEKIRFLVYIHSLIAQIELTRRHMCLLFHSQNESRT